MEESGSASSEIRITYETLYELLRREKGRETLQELSKTFFADVAEYIRDKNKMLLEHHHKQDLFSISERDKVQQQLNNIRKILTELYDRRQKKIISMASNKAIVNSASIDTSALLETEKRFYTELLGLFVKYREGVLYSLLQANADFNIPEAHIEQKPAEQNPSEETPKTESTASESQKETMMLRFVKPVPRFLGMNSESYGPFEEEDMATMPSNLASLLIAKGKAEEIVQKEQ